MQTPSAFTKTTPLQLPTTTTTEINNEILITSFSLDKQIAEKEEEGEMPASQEDSSTDDEEEDEQEQEETTTPIEILDQDAEMTTPFIETSTVASTTVVDLQFRQNIKPTIAETADGNDETNSAQQTLTDASSQIQNFKAVNVAPKSSEVTHSLITPMSRLELSSSSSFTLSRASPQLNVALYIVICLLCFSLIINIILLYVSKMKQNSREKLIITHEICGKSLVNTPSQRSGIDSTKTSNSEEIGDCNVNLINSNGSATSGIDSEH